MKPAFPSAAKSVAAAMCAALLLSCSDRREVVETHPDGSARVVEWRDADGNLTARETRHFNALRRSRVRYEGGVPHGDYRSWRSDGTAEWTGSFKNGKRDGLWTLHVGANREVAEQGEWRDGLKTGVWTKRHPGGALAEETTWCGGERCGKSVSFFPDGTKKSESDCFDGTVPTEKRRLRRWNREGRLELEHGCVGETPTGKWTRWDFLGHKMEETNLDADGLPDGERRLWRATGALLALSTWRHGSRDGLQRKFAKDGSLLMDCLLENGTGRCVELCARNRAFVCADTSWREGRPDGRATKWGWTSRKKISQYENGEVRRLEIWAMKPVLKGTDTAGWDSTKIAEGGMAGGRREGPWKRWDENGTLAAESFWKNDSLFGEEILYNADGSVFQRRVHKGPHRGIEIYSANSASKDPLRAGTSTRK